MPQSMPRVGWCTRFGHAHAVDDVSGDPSVCIRRSSVLVVACALYGSLTTAVSGMSIVVGPERTSRARRRGVIHHLPGGEVFGGDFLAVDMKMARPSPRRPNQSLQPTSMRPIRLCD